MGVPHASSTSSCRTSSARATIRRWIGTSSAGVSAYQKIGSPLSVETTWTTLFSTTIAATGTGSGKTRRDDLDAGVRVEHVEHGVLPARRAGIAGHHRGHDHRRADDADLVDPPAVLGLPHPRHRGPRLLDFCGNRTRTAGVPPPVRPVAEDHGGHRRSPGIPDSPLPARRRARSSPRAADGAATRRSRSWRDCGAGRRRSL